MISIRLLFSKWSFLSPKQQAEKRKSRKMKDEGWVMKDEGGFAGKQTNEHMNEQTDGHLWL